VKSVSRYRDTEDGMVICIEHGTELLPRQVDDHTLVFHPDTENRSLAEGERSSALTGVAPQSVSSEQVIPEALQKSTFLPAGAFRTSDHMYYFNGDGPVPGATSVLEVLSKPALVTWKAQETARALWRYVTDPLEWPPQKMPTETEVVNWALQEADKQRDTAAKLGSSIHLLADMVSRASESPVEGFHVSEQEKPYLEAWRQFLGWLSLSGGKIVSSEHMVWSLNGYGGTYDLIIEWQGQLWLLDIKTSKGYYPEYGLQLAAYRWADSIILEGNPTPYPMPEIHKAGVLHLRPDQYPDTGWRLIEYPITYEKDYMTFLGALEVYRWRKEGRFLKRCSESSYRYRSVEGLNSILPTFTATAACQ
jgi:hypothetical protein